MAGKGPPRKPTAILAARGSWRAKTRTGEPDPPAGVPQCPVKLDATGRAVWRRVLVNLQTLGVLRTTDANIAARYAWTMVRWDAARREVDEHGDTETVTTENGSYTQITAAAKRADALGNDCRRMEQELGLTPAARARLIADAPRGSTDKAKKFFGKVVTPG